MTRSSRPRRRMSPRNLLSLVLLFLYAVGQGVRTERIYAVEALDLSALPAAAEQEIDFAEHIRPILQTRCYSCHGPEESESGLRLDLKKAAFEGGDGGAIIEIGKSADSRLIHYVAGLDEDMLMPPDGEGSPLTGDQVALLRAWIDQGASWPAEADGDADHIRGADHWAFQPIANPPVPQIDDAWQRNEIDAFVLAKLRSEGVKPSPEAARHVLIRRVYLDLIGLSPSPEELERWTHESSDDWYAMLVDHLLASPHYGERWGRHWLDLARYADSDGFEKDLPRPHAWRWRDWVISALNRDLPFDQFTIEQLAGDLLPDRDLEQLVATGFHRNTLVNREGGIDPEEDRVKRTVDRTNTLGSVWLGMTVECSQCHSHKYDPLSQREYYQLYAFFNNLEEPDVPAPYDEELEAYRAAKAEFDKKHQKYLDAIADYRASKLPAGLAAWEEEQADQEAQWFVLKPSKVEASSGATIETQADGSQLVSGYVPSRDIYNFETKTEPRRVTAIRLEVLPDATLPKNGPGRGDNGNILLNEIKLFVRSADDDAERQVKFADARASFAQNFYGPAGALLENRQGWALLPRVGERHAAIFELEEPLEIEGDAVLRIEMKQEYGGGRVMGRFRLALTDRDSKAVEFDAISDRLVAILSTPVAERDERQAAELLDYFGLFDPGLVALQKEEVADREMAPPDPRQSTRAQVVKEQRQRRATQVHIRGDFLRPGAEVAASTPAVLPPLSARGKAPDRLDLARWLVDSSHPLTARVVVNRVWQRYFQRGIVNTLHDFGTQGDPPSHPELLDHLAYRFREGGWKLKDLHRRIVTSATYRQSSHARPDLEERDPLNIWLARQNRLRMEAEIIRDVALRASGLLNEKIGGRSVRPPQPKGLAELGYANSVKWVTSEGPDRYRRGLYTFFQRTVPYPMLMTFDAPDSNVACTRRDRSNTPLQALTLWNDPVFVECSQSLALRLVTDISEGDTDQGDVPRVAAATADGADSLTARRVRHAFRLCLAREPAAEELSDFVNTFDTMRELYAKYEEAALAATGAVERPTEIEPAELAAWVAVSRALMNLDEFIVRE
ncbi:MAG: DUF1553 domain-containing protein [Planctomycetota bacterium]|nr:MAG: DUF1553 domain-containing protein [Planctomycetota bacterium]REK31416.1 MAG: DUF1553 domain-containing protein [Planctomycetota bacterium]REK40646.1 MAG: DUF1553 domain-containing protein [Planctomycetota bacterium]